MMVSGLDRCAGGVSSCEGQLKIAFLGLIRSSRCQLAKITRLSSMLTASLTPNENS